MLADAYNYQLPSIPDHRSKIISILNRSANFKTTHVP
jgi:hypothetical protein